MRIDLKTLIVTSILTGVVCFAAGFNCGVFGKKKISLNMSNFVQQWSKDGIQDNTLSNM